MSSELMHPTRAKLKKVCIRLCEGEISNKDKKVIRDFCKKWDETKTFLQNISTYDEDKFRPLSDYLNDTTGNKNTDPANIELLACLINFPYRPYDYTKDYESLLQKPAETLLAGQEAGSGIVNNTIIESPIDINNQSLHDAATSCDLSAPIPDVTASTFTVQTEPSADDMAEVKPIKKPKKETKSRFTKGLRLGILLIILLTGYWWYKSTLNTGGCMYWVGDHFEPIPCDRKIQDTYVVALDTFRLRHFKKIASFDSLTSLKGRVWYSKINNQLEYFTAGGKHPVFMNYRLKPITKHIIDTYITQPEQRAN